MVQLKAASISDTYFNSIISIPNGSIKRVCYDKINVSVWQFQFLMVQLKVLPDTVNFLE